MRGRPTDRGHIWCLDIGGRIEASAELRSLCEVRDPSVRSNTDGGGPQYLRGDKRQEEEMHRTFVKVQRSMQKTVRMLLELRHLRYCLIARQATIKATSARLAGLFERACSLLFFFPVFRFYHFLRPRSCPD